MAKFDEGCGRDIDEMLEELKYFNTSWAIYYCQQKTLGETVDVIVLSDMLSQLQSILNRYKDNV